MSNSYQRSAPHLFLIPFHLPYGGSIFLHPAASCKDCKPFCSMDKLDYIYPPKCFLPLVFNWAHFLSYLFSFFFLTEYTSFSLPFYFPVRPKVLALSIIISLPLSLPFSCCSYLSLFPVIYPCPCQLPR